MSDEMRNLAEDLFPDDPRPRKDDDGDGEMMFRTLGCTFGGLAVVASKYKEQIICLVVFLVVVALYFLTTVFQ